MLTLLFAIPWFNGLLSTRVSLTCSRSHAFQPYLSKCISGIQQKCAQLLTPFSDTAFCALSHGVICICYLKKNTFWMVKIIQQPIRIFHSCGFKALHRKWRYTSHTSKIRYRVEFNFSYTLQVVTKKLAALIQSFSFILIFMSFDFFSCQDSMGCAGVSEQRLEVDIKNTLEWKPPSTF